MLVDISKLVCLVEKYAHRLQIQERLTKQIADELIGMGIKGVSIIVEAEHLCMKMRGVRSDSSVMTVCHRGIMEQKDSREHILSMTHVPKPKL